MKKYFLISIFFLSIPATAQTNYAVVIDAGATTQLHLYSYQQEQDIPQIHEMFLTKNTTDLSTFAFSPESAGATLAYLLDSAVKRLTLEKIDPSTVPIEIYGTEKMRALTSMQQAAIYNSIAQYIHLNYDLYLDHIETLSGKMLGIDYWLDANYLAGSFYNHSTLGMLNIGDLASDFTYEVHAMTEDVTQLDINHQSYLIFSKNIQDLGQENLRLKINEEAQKNSCYPIGSPNLGNFNQYTCGELYQKSISSFHLETQFMPFEQNHFVTSIPTAKIYEFLAAEIPDQEAFAARMYYVCSTPWNLMKKEYEGESESELLNFCAHAVFIHELFYKTFHFQAQQLWITDRIAQQKIDWPLGSLFYLLISSNLHPK